MSRLPRLLAASIAALAATVAPGAPAPVGAAESTPNACYVAANHRIFLDRDATSDELVDWDTAFDSGTPHHALPAELAASDEWLSVVIARMYHEALDRDPEPEGEAYWIDQLRAGAMVTRIAAMVFGSDELYDRVGRDDEALVRTFYALILDRSAGDRSAPRRVGQPEIDHWVDQIPTLGRGGVAAAIHGSFESRARRVDRLYRSILDRSAEPAGRTYWAGRLATINDVRLAVFLASSGELRTRTARGCTLTGQVTFTDLVPAAEWATDPDVSHDGRYVAFTGSTSGSDGVHLLDTATGTTTNLTAATTRHASEPVISADGSTVAYLVAASGGFRRTVIVHDLDDATTTDVTAATDSDVGYLSLSGDGTLVAFSSYAEELTPDPVDDVQDVFVHDRTTDEVVNVTAGGNGGSFDPVLSDDGTRMVFRSEATNLDGSSRGHIALFAADLATGAITGLTPGIDRQVDDGPSISADGSTVAFSSRAAALTGDPDNDDAHDVFITSTSAGGSIANVTATTYLASGAEDDGSISPALAGDGASVTFETAAPELVGEGRRSVVRAT